MLKHECAVRFTYKAIASQSMSHVQMQRKRKQPLKLAPPDQVQRGQGRGGRGGKQKCRQCSMLMGQDVPQASHCCKCYLFSVGKRTERDCDPKHCKCPLCNPEEAQKKARATALQASRQQSCKRTRLM